jgi:hypothetical protein
MNKAPWCGKGEEESGSDIDLQEVTTPRKKET